MQDAITDGYSMYACGSKPSTISPVGEAYRIFKNENPEEFKSLYRRDGSHPTGPGHYLAACVHFSTLFGKPCLGNSFTNAWVSKEVATKLQTAADSAIEIGKWNFDEETDCDSTLWTNCDLTQDLANVGKECYGECNGQGKCPFCGTKGYCCRLGWLGNGCNGIMGISYDYHRCVLP